MAASSIGCINTILNIEMVDLLVSASRAKNREVLSRSRNSVFETSPTLQYLSIIFTHRGGGVHLMVDKVMEYCLHRFRG